MLRDDGCRTTLTSRLALCFLTFFGVVGDVEVGSAMVAVAIMYSALPKPRMQTNTVFSSTNPQPKPVLWLNACARSMAALIAM